MSKIQQLRELMQARGVEAYYIPNNDEFQNEYLPDSAKRVEFLSGFTGSAGTIVVGLEKAAFFTDGRYTVQAAAEVDSELFEVFNLADKLPKKWADENGLELVYDPDLVTIDQAERLGGKALEGNLVDEVWGDARLTPPNSKTEIFPVQYAGKTIYEKIALVAENLEPEADAVLITTPDSVNWLFNIRGSDIEYTPFCLAYAAIYKNGRAVLFIDRDKLGDELQKYLNEIEIQDTADFGLKDVKTVQLDPKLCPLSIKNSLKCKILHQSDPCQLLKSIKNDAEIETTKNAQKLDGIAVTKFIEWVKSNPNQTEISAAEKLEEFRRENPEYQQPSFATISGFGSNGAIVHYHATEKTNKKFESGTLYLVDSGGQYLGGQACGTTDVTRTIAIGKPTDEMRRDYTLVLKGHIAIATAVFPPGTSGAQLDAFARQFLWAEGKDYDHGTGHGVGHYLSVHEGPCGISKRYSNTKLEPGMILSNEPGFYKEGEYGIRIENLVLVVENPDNTLSFNTITLAPLDEDLIEWEILTEKENQWIKEYQQAVSSNQ